MPAHQAAVWIDHHEARIFRVDGGKFDASTISAPTRHVHRHPKGGTAEHNHPDDMQHFFEEVARALDGIEEILVVGPSTAKLQFIRYAHRHAPALETKIVGVETSDHPTDGQLVSHARRYFGLADRLP